MINKKRSFSSKPAPKSSSRFSGKRTFSSSGKPQESSYEKKHTYKPRFADQKGYDSERSPRDAGRSYGSDDSRRPSRFSDNRGYDAERSSRPAGRSYGSDDSRRPSRFSDNRGYDAERSSRPAGRSYGSDDSRRSSRFSDKPRYSSHRPAHFSDKKNYATEKPFAHSEKPFKSQKQSHDFEDFDAPLSFAEKKQLRGDTFSTEYSVPGEKNYSSNKSSSRPSERPSGAGRYDKKPASLSTAVIPDRRFNEMVFGAHSLIEVLKAKKRKVVQIYTTKPTPRSWERVQPYMPAYPIQTQYVDVTVLDRMAGTKDHMGIIAWVTPFRFRSKMFNPQSAPFIVLLDAVQDVRNLGAILRSASCIGVSGVVLCKSMAAPLTGAAFKASAGLAEHLDIYVAPSLRAAVQDIKQAGYHLYLAVLENGEDATEVTFTRPGCLVIGNEAAGITKEIRTQGTLVTLPQRVPDVSFNASVAAGILMFLMAHQAEKPAKASQSGAEAKK